jgi:hypothetical protein
MFRLALSTSTRARLSHFASSSAASATRPHRSSPLSTLSSSFSSWNSSPFHSRHHCNKSHQATTTNHNPTLPSPHTIANRQQLARFATTGEFSLLILYRTRIRPIFYPPL